MTFWSAPVNNIAVARSMAATVASVLSVVSTSCSPVAAANQQQGAVMERMLTSGMGAGVWQPAMLSTATDIRSVTDLLIFTLVCPALRSYSRPGASP